ncbi:MAG: DUF898 family protein [Rhizomicrobium sp.]
MRTQRYFYGNTYLAGQSFEYHASAWRILVGRAIALALFLGYSLSVVFVPFTFGIWFLILGAALPWLANASIRFNARNTSWRNVRFNFNATYFEAFIAYVVWSAAALAFFPLIPYTRRVHDYFYINHHRFGGRGFETSFPARRIYFVYLFGFILVVVLLVGADRPCRRSGGDRDPCPHRARQVRHPVGSGEFLPDRLRAVRTGRGVRGELRDHAGDQSVDRQHDVGRRLQAVVQGVGPARRLDRGDERAADAGDAGAVLSLRAHKAGALPHAQIRPDRERRSRRLHHRGAGDTERHRQEIAGFFDFGFGL